ncbi:MAG TPA: response regulator transcription factor [Candidatus Babeliales bacterium]|uniref:response regulator n=1 Tax=Pseudomonas sp. TaxID=306 RepID=UPI002CAC10C2|nr:response regulator transcription factor [Candidatus Babeliales bacterium]
MVGQHARSAEFLRIYDCTLGRLSAVRRAIKYINLIKGNSMAAITSVLIIDDDPFMRAALGVILLANKYRVAGEADNGNDCLRLAKRHADATLMLLDLDMPKMEGLGVLSKMRRGHPRLPVLVLSMLDPQIYAPRCMRLGAQGFLSKSDAVALLPTMLDRLKNGQRLYPKLGPVDGMPWCDLSDGELVYLRCLARDYEDASIASALQISAERVRLLCKLLQAKLGLSTIAEMRCFSQRLRLG